MKHLKFPYLYFLILIMLFWGLWPFNFFQKNNVSYIPNGGISFSFPSIAYTTVPLFPLHKLKAFTILLSLSSDCSELEEYPKILTYSLDKKHINFIIGQWKNNLFFRLCTDSKRLKSIYFESSEIFTKNKKALIAIVYNGNKLLLYKDGIIKNEREIGFVDISKWDHNFPLVLGNDPHGKSKWKGTIYSVSLFDKALSSEAIRSMLSNVAQMEPLLYYDFLGSKSSIIKNLGKLDFADITIPHCFTPYKRIFFEIPPLRLQHYRYDIKDIIINLLGFIPFGFLIMQGFKKNGTSITKAFFLSILSGFFLSLIIEFLQAFLPTRSSDVIDLIMNTLGTLTGIFFWLIFYKTFVKNYLRF